MKKNSWYKKCLISGSLLVSMGILNAQHAGSPTSNGEPLLLKTFDGYTIEIPELPENRFVKLPKAPVEGYYLCTWGPSLYLSPKSQLQIKLTDSGWVYKGRGSKENEFLRSIPELYRGYFEMNGKRLAGDWWKTDVETFVTRYNEMTAHIHKQLEVVKGSPWFTRMAFLSAEIYWRRIVSDFQFQYGMNPDILMEAAQLAKRRAPRDSIDRLMSKVREKQLSADQRNQLDSMILGGVDWNDEALFKFSYEYRVLIQTLLVFRESQQQAQVEEPANAMEKKLLHKLIQNEFIREYYYFKSMSDGIKNAEDYQKLEDLYNRYLAKAKNEYFIKEVKTAFDNRKHFVRGAEAPGFNFTDTAGTMFSLKTFRGKYVYIDLWATWCGPCVQEIPRFEKLAAHYQNKNISFISISIDALNDRLKWRDFIRAKQLKGIQLMADKAWESDFLKRFNIKSIPHFILIDPAGKIVDPHAKTPSDPALYKELDQIL